MLRIAKLIVAVAFLAYLSLGTFETYRKEEGGHAYLAMTDRQVPDEIRAIKRELQGLPATRGLLAGFEILGQLSVTIPTALTAGTVADAVGVERGSDDHEPAARFSRTIGLVAGSLSVAIPVMLWLGLMWRWRPSTKTMFACRFALWPAVITSCAIGGPLASAICNPHVTVLGSSAGERLFHTMQGWVGASVILAPMFLGIGFMIAAMRFRGITPVNASPVRASDQQLVDLARQLDDARRVSPPRDQTP